VTVESVDDPRILEDLFRRDTETHIYGLADLDEPFWSASTWYVDGDAAVGRVSVGTDWTAGYAMSRQNPEGTLRLLAKIAPTLPSGTWITGPIGLAERLGTGLRVESKGPHWRFILDDLAEDVDRTDVVQLTEDDLPALEDLYRSDPDSAFFLPSMLASGYFVGIWRKGELISSAGTHVASTRHQVAAIGAVITHPSERRSGLGGRVTAALCSTLIARFRTVGLNVAESNTAALLLYERLGFRAAFRYEEVELL